MFNTPHSPTHSETVHFDLDHNVFITINKQTGNEFVSRKNGVPLPTFKPNVTGFHYNLRKMPAPVQTFSSRPSQAPQRLESLYTGKHKTFDALDSSQKRQMPKHITIRTKDWMSKRELENIKAYRKFQAQHSQDFEEMSPEKVAETQRQQALFKTIQQYSQLMRDKPQQNHSPKHGVPPGERPVDPMSVLCRTLTDFRKADPAVAKSLHQKREDRVPSQLRSGRLQELQTGSLLRREKQVFYRFHPEMHQQDKIERLSAFKERRKNMLKLEKLFLKQTSKITSQIYK